MIEELRCKKCQKKLGEKLSGKVEIVCPRCSTFNVFGLDYSSHKLVALETKLRKT